MSGGSDERRRHQREPLTLKVEYADAGQLLSDYTENISRGGTFVLTERDLEVGTPVKLSLAFAGLIRPIILSGTVKWTRSEPPEERGVGVEFEPASADATARLDELVQRIAASDPELVARTLRVLVVEDNPHVAALIRDGLTGGGRRELLGRVAFQFTTVGNGRDALEALRGEGRFDVLIVDIYLPVLDGVHVIQEVRKTPALQRLPIVAVSAGGPSAREAALDAGADFFLEKPMRLADILATMRRLTGLE